MPLTPKVNSPLASNLSVKITAEEYNLHDGEIRAVEEFMGDNGSFPWLGSPKPDIDKQAPSQGKVLDQVSSLISRMNSFSDPAGGANVISGQVVSGKRVGFPEAAHATFLAAYPDADDSTMTVNSTMGFPDQGTISILNEVIISHDGMSWVVPASGSMVEWIRYAKKNGTQFLQCQRGYMGTTASRHVLFDHASLPQDTTKNARDYLGDIKRLPLYESSHLPIVPTRRYVSWRSKSAYSFDLVSISGDLVEVTWRIARRGGFLRVPSDNSDMGTTQFVAAATPLGILATRTDGTYYLKSNDPALAAKGQLSWAESNSLVGSLLANGGIKLVDEPDDWTWPVIHVPVFQGRLSIQYDSLSVARSDLSGMTALRFTQTCMGNVYFHASKSDETYQDLFGTAGYHCFFVASQTDEATRDNQSIENGVK